MNTAVRNAVECMVVTYAKLPAVTNIFRHLVDAYFCEIRMPKNLTCVVHDYIDRFVCLLVLFHGYHMLFTNEAVIVLGEVVVVLISL